MAGMGLTTRDVKDLAQRRTLDYRNAHDRQILHTWLFGRVIMPTGTYGRAKGRTIVLSSPSPHKRR